MRVAITGGTGFVGRYLVMGLLDKGYEVACLVRNSAKAQKFFGPSVKTYELSLKTKTVFLKPLKTSSLKFLCILLEFW